MSKRSIVFVISALFLCVNLTASDQKAPSTECFIDENFHRAELGFQQHWHDFAGDASNFPIWKAGWSEEELSVRFEKMMKERLAVYFTNPQDYTKKNAIWRFKEDYKTPENWKSWGSRFPSAGAFAYNVATPSYNASLITLHGMRFIALEGPSAENLKAFFQIITDYKVSSLVRLTPVFSDNRENCFPYWNGRTEDCCTIEIDHRKISYFAIEDWANHVGIEPDRLLELVKDVQNSVGKDPVIAVHCRAGVGRTGTFIAAYALIHDIDQQIANGVDVDQLEIGIDKILWELSLQRPFTVNHLLQYLTLHKLVDLYTESLRSGCE